jgi:hypothetical protein
VTHRIAMPEAALAIKTGVNENHTVDCGAENSEHQIHHQHHYDQKQHGHDATGAHEIRYPVAARAHDNGVDLMGRDQK